MFLKSLALSGIAALCASAASAVPVTIDLTGRTGQTSVLSVEGLTDLALTVTATSFDEAGAMRLGDDSDVSLNAGGLGVLNSVSSADPEKNVFVDGRSPSDINDVLVFDFDRAVNILDIGLMARDPAMNSMVALFLPVGGMLTLVSQSTLDAVNVPGFVTSFGLGGLGSNDQFLVSSLTVEAPAAVPIPAAGVLLLGSLAGLGLLRRRG